MKSTTRKDAQKLIRDPLSFAMMMDNSQLEEVIVVFVPVLNRRKPERGDENQNQNFEPNSY